MSWLEICFTWKLKGRFNTNVSLTFWHLSLYVTKVPGFLFWNHIWRKERHNKIQRQSWNRREDGSTKRTNRWDRLAYQTKLWLGHSLAKAEPMHVPMTPLSAQCRPLGLYRAGCQLGQSGLTAGKSDECLAKITSILRSWVSEIRMGCSLWKDLCFLKM